MLSSCSADKNLPKEQFLLATHHKCCLIDRKGLLISLIADYLFLNVKDANVVNQLYFSF